MPGEPAAPVSGDADEDEIAALDAESAIERVADVPWLSQTGGPTVLYRAYFDSDPSAGALNLANLLDEECRPRGVTVEIKGDDEYTGIELMAAGQHSRVPADRQGLSGAKPEVGSVHVVVDWKPITTTVRQCWNRSQPLQ